MRSTTAALIMAFVGALAVQAAPTGSSADLAVRSNTVNIGAAAVRQVDDPDFDEPEGDVEKRSPKKKGKKKKAAGAAGAGAAGAAAARNVNEDSYEMDVEADEKRGLAAVRQTDEDPDFEEPEGDVEKRDDPDFDEPEGDVEKRVPSPKKGKKKKAAGAAGAGAAGAAAARSVDEDSYEMDVEADD